MKGKYSKLTDVSENVVLIQQLGVLMNNVEEYEFKIQACHEKIDEINDLVDDSNASITLDSDQQAISDEFKTARADMKTQLDIVSPRKKIAEPEAPTD